MNLLEIAERVEALSGPDREVDALIREVAGVHPRFVYARAYTASLDAAMTLVPSGHQWGVQSFDGAAPAIGWIGKDWIVRNAATPALALCAAALRASERASGGEG